MNYLAHAYLSFGHKEVLTGNMISDFVKGKTRFQYPAGIQKGIMLHRAIDAFTDTHAATKKAMEVFRPAYRLYSGPIMDVLYDHFLASDAAIFTSDTLLHFSKNVYSTLDENAAHLPPYFNHMLTYMKTENWLYNYQSTAGIEKSLKGLSRRAVYMADSSQAIELFHNQYGFLKECYHIFMEDVKKFAKQQFDELTG
jgi:acyl carrier protein phosphodiesterase